MNAIVLDDEKESLLLFTSHVIDMKGISITVFSKKWEDALTFMNAHPVDIAFLDIVMPEINGIDLAERMIVLNPRIRIVFITGFSQDVEKIKERIGSNFFAFCYKPYDEETIKGIIVRAMNDSKAKIVFKTFPHFDLYVNDVLVDFKRAKAKELLALLVDHRGGEVTMEEAITKLWIDKNVVLAKRLYRDAVCRLRMKLKQYGIENIVNFNRARMSLNVKDIECDSWNHLDCKETLFCGEYMRPYEWAVEKENFFLNCQIKNS